MFSYTVTNFNAKKSIRRKGIWTHSQNSVAAEVALVWFVVTFGEEEFKIWRPIQLADLGNKDFTGEMWNVRKYCHHPKGSGKNGQ